VLFNSYSYIAVFLPLTLTGFFLLARRGGQAAAILWLIVLSCIFYGWWKPAYVLLLAASILFNYGCGKILLAARGRGPALPTLVFGVSTNLAVLGYFKYTGFFADIANMLLGTGFSVDAVALPLAISFFTFQQIAYLVDAYKQEVTDSGLLRYCLFISFFPQLIAGPIVHHKDFVPQFQQARVFQFVPFNLAMGSAVFIIGLFKKVVIADSLDAYVTPIFAMAASGQDPGFAQSWLGATAYSFQVYFDFSGYSDMAVGAALMIGIHLPVNFFSPYKATSITELWRRWHMTLTRLIREYIFMPISLRFARYSVKLSRSKWQLLLLANVVPLTVTFVLVGLWHGAGWTFVLFGLFHGILLSLHAVWQELQRSTPLRKIQVPAALGVAFTLLAWVWSMILFRAENLGAAMLMYGSMFDVSALAHGIGDHLPMVGVFLALYIVVLCLPNTEQLFNTHRPRLPDKSLERLRTSPRLAWRESPSWAIALAFMFFVSAMLMTREVKFIYFQF